MKVDFLDLKRINESYEPGLSEVISNVIKSGHYILGEQVRTFEKNLADYLGVNHTVGTGNGLDALRLILRGYIELGLMNEGDEIIVPANTFIASILAISSNNLIPVLVEPDLQTYNLDVSQIEAHITSRTRAIMVVHLYGRICWGEELTYLAQKYNLKIIEDNAQAMGATIKLNSKVIKSGALGDAAGLSFYPAKNLGALGDGGAVATNDDLLAKTVRALSNYGSHRKYYIEYQGVNSRLDEIQAAILNLKLTKLDEDNEHRRTIASYYIRSIDNQSIVLPGEVDERIEENTAHVWHLFVIRSQHRDRLKDHLAKRGIVALIHYPVPPHLQKAYNTWINMHLPVTEQIHQEVLSLPISQVMTAEEAEYVALVVNNH